MRARIRQFWESRSGSTAIEYALMGVLLAIAAIVGAEAVGTKVTQMYDHQAEVVKEAVDK